ncbi:S8 family serine peptidase [Streptomyces sp. NPDC048606]|uniref:S8 family serine peptidase n=1 Tax=Streptomyces sp. NPDC048606 TaxID=3154726 RepID=UPI0034170677
MDFTKLAPPLAAVYERYEQQGRRRAPLAPQARTLGLVSVRERAKPLRMVVSLICDPEADLGQGPDEHGLGDGVVVNAGGRTVRTAIVALDALERLAAHPAVRRIVPSTRLRPCLNLAQEKVHVQRFRESSGTDGQGVVVGVVDTGIDPRHPAFAGRIDRIWDQTIRGGDGVPEGRYGAEFRQPQPGAGASGTLSRDVEGHGTHVAGIAAGTSGVAPGSRLVIVKTDFQDAHIIDAVQYVFRVARDLGLPAVVNLSLGGHSDPHDGTDAMSRAIEEESGPGRIVVCAAGNEGDDDIHARLRIAEGAVRSVPCHPGILDGEPDVFALNGWYGGGDRFEIAMATPSGVTTPFRPVRTSASPAAEFELDEGLVQIVTPGPSPDNGDVNFFVQVQPEPLGPGAPRGPWRLLVRGESVADGTVDVWMLGGPDARPQPQFSGPVVHDALKIGSPGAAPSAVTVAAATTRTEWKDIDGVEERAPWLELGDIASFSSEGPLRDGTPKPDVAAPGAIIISSLSRDARDQPREFITSPRDVGMQGTSMASPFIAGIAALVLERDATCDPEGFKELLKANARVPGGGAGTFHPKWGHGLLDATGL